MKKKTVLALALASVMGMTGAAFAAEKTFEDVPTTHWAYKAVNDLHKAGIVEGENGRYAGDRTLTRYEMAMIVANAMTKMDKADNATRATVEKLQAEFAKELKELGIRVNTLEKKQPNLKFNGILEQRFSITDYTSSSKDTTRLSQYRLRLEGAAKVDDKTTFGMRFVTRQPSKSKFGNDTWQEYGSAGESSANVNNIDRVFFTTKLNGVAATVGRQSLYVDSQSMAMDPGAFSYDGVKAAWKAGDVDLAATYGRFVKGAVYANTTLNTVANNLDVKSIAANKKFGKANIGLAYHDFTNPSGDLDVMQLTQVNAIYKFTDKLSLNALYVENSAPKLVAGLGDSAWAAKIVCGDQAMNKAKAHNITYQYVDKKANAFINAFSALDLTSGRMADLNVDYTMQNIQYNYAFSKSFNARLSYTKLTPDRATSSDAAQEAGRVVFNVLF